MLLSPDPRQRHRMRRYLMAVGTSLLVLFVLALLELHGQLEGTAVVHAAVAMLALFAVFYVLFRSGLNERLAEPSLTAAQMLSAFVLLAYVMFYATYAGRGMIVYAFLVNFLFGLFRLGVRALVALAAIAAALYGTSLAAIFLLRPANFDVHLELLRWAIVSAVLFWFALMGGYIARMRKQLGETNAKLEDAVRTIQDLATHDELTGVPNRRFLVEVLRHEVARSQRSGALFCVCLVDIDFFKRINDQLGHQAGDEVLRQFARGVSKETRGTDYFGRYGGEEFLLILTDTTIAGAGIRAERLRDSAAKMQFPKAGSETAITISIGVSQHVPGEGFEQTIKRADAALYRAKDSGRNRVVFDESAGAPWTTAAAPVPIPHVSVRKPR